MSRKQRIIEIIADLAEWEESEVTRNTQLRQELGFDSLDLNEVAATIEDEIKVEIRATKHWYTVQDVLDDALGKR